MKFRIFTVAALALAFVFPAFAAGSTSASPTSASNAVHPPGAAIASGHALATEAGFVIIRAGGNACDAAVAVSSTRSVVEPISLEEPVYTDGGDAMYVIDQVRDPDGEDSWISGLQFRQTVAGLTPREKRIMELRYLKGETQMEVAREIGISQAQVSRLEKAALEQFRHK